MKTIQQIEAASARQAECETALIELAIEMGQSYQRSKAGTVRPTSADVLKRYKEGR